MRRSRQTEAGRAALATGPPLSKIRVGWRTPVADPAPLSFIETTMNPRYYEDYTVGEVVEAPGFTLTEAEILHFALAYDPQPFHLDVEKAKESIYGGLIASGWQVAVLGFRMMVQAGLVGPASLGSPGIERLRWLKPVRPGDTLYPGAKITAARLSASKPDRGLVTVEWWVKNQTGETVCTLVSTQLVRRRPA